MDSRLGGDGPGPRGRVALTVGESLLLPASSRRFSRVPIRTPDFHRLLASRPCSVVKVALAFRRAYEYAVLHHASPPRGDCGPGSIEEVRRHCNTQSTRSPSVVSGATSRAGHAVVGMVRPSALAVLRLMASSNFVGCSTGRSAGWAPFRILSTYVAARRKLSGPRPRAPSARTSPVLGVVLRGRRSVLCGKETSRLAVREGHRHAAWSAPQMRSRTHQACGG